MQHVRWTSRPQLRQPVLLAAFEGWNDAGDAASGAVRYLRDRWEAEPFAEIDPEDFYDFTSTRPMVRLTEDMTREIVWPTNQFSSTRVPNGPDVILLLGHEPQLKWPTFCRQVTDIARAYGTKLVVTLGALLAEVAHTRPVAVTGTAYDAEVEASLRLKRSRYEGPTGIVGVLHDACRKAGLRSGSLWATVPTYVPGAPSPKATLALVERLTKLLDITLTTTDLEIASASYERQINELVADDEETAEYVTRLEERHDSGEEDDDMPSLIEEVERFLREQPGD